MSSQKYKNIILSSIVLGTIGLSTISVNIEAMDNKKEEGNNTILNHNSSINGVENEFSERNFSINSVDTEGNNLANNSNSRINIGSTVRKGPKEKIGDWQVQWWIDGGYAYCELLEYQGNSLNIDLSTDIGNKSDNVILDTSNLKKIIPNYKNIENINLGSRGSGFIKPSKVQDNKVTAVTNIDFSGFSSLQSVTLNRVDSSRVTSLSNMFADCSSLVSVNLSAINTWNVTSFRDMFARCTSLRSVNLKGGNFNTSNVTDMQGVFYQCSSLTNVDLSSWNTNKVTNFQGMFGGCNSLNNLDLSNWDTSRAIDFSGMFKNCHNLSSLNLKKFNTSNATMMQEMFYGCNKLTTLDLSSFVLNSGVNDSGMFTTSSTTELLVLTNDDKLKSFDYKKRFNRVPINGPILDANGGEFSDKQKVKKYFEKCAYEPNKINLVEFEQFKKENKPTNNGFAHDLLGWQKEGTGSDNPSTVLDILGNTYKAQWGNRNWEFEEDESRILLKKYKGESNEIVIPSNSNGKKIVLKDINTTIIPTRVIKFSVEPSEQYKVGIEDNNLNFAFDGNSNLQEVDFRGLDTSNITKMEVMFRNCTNLEKANFSDIDMSKVVAMDYNFQNCRNLTEVNFDNVDVSSLVNTQHMFSGCDNLKFLDLSSFQLPSNANCSNMFYTNAQTELLVLTNDEKIKGLNYQNDHRIPLDGVKLSGNGGIFSNTQNIKKYFEECVYTPEKIELSEFEKFKNTNIPVRQEFATIFSGWKAKQDEPQNPTNVLDLGSLTYEAKWEDPDWEFTETEDEIKLTRYKGTNSEVNIPVYADGKSFKISNFSEKLIPKTVTKIICRPDSSGRKLFYESDGMSSAFSQYKNLVEIDLTGIDIKNVTNLGHMFYQCTNLEKVDISNFDTSKVKWLDSMFENCFKLTNIDVTNWDTSNVTNMARMFFNVPIECLDLSNWKTPRLKSTNRMFNGCNNLKLIKMENFDMSKVDDSAAMFYRGNATETLVVTRDKKLLNEYGFKNDNTYPVSKPVLDANGGNFEDGHQIKKYFDSSAVLPETLQISKFEEFQHTYKPIKDNCRFRGWDLLDTTKSSDEGVLELINNTYVAIWKNMFCNTSSDNRKIDTQGDIGLVYIPNKFSIPKTKLNDSGEQIISFNKDDSLNIGVRDLSQSNSSWSLTGRLEWINKEIPGAYIQVESNQNSIKKNINDNTNPFDSSRDLINAEEEVRPTQSDNGYLKITNNSTNKLMEANSNKTHDNIYDYDLGNASLVIPDTKYIQFGEYTANVEWNLTNAPQ
ncbi:BspA family leucine-rich repeat surface protein [Enterococcus faecium]|nr:BspA family leucine-rich repeat surface protein [Enterococcus faecium]